MRRPPRWLRPLVALAGACLLVAGAVALFTIDNSAGSLFLVALGTALVLVALVRRVELESFELFGAKLKVRDVVGGRLRLAESAHDAAGAAAREQAAAVQKLAGLYDLYRYVRRTQPASPARTATLDRLAGRMQAVASDAAFDAAEVATWFHDGDDALRVIALNVMLVRPESRDLPALLYAVDEPRSNFEQFYGLLLADRAAGDLADFERALLADAIRRAQRTRRVRRDASLRRVADGVLTKVRA